MTLPFWKIITEFSTETSLNDLVYVVDVVNGGMSPVSVKNMARGIVALWDAIQQ